MDCPSSPITRITATTMVPMAISAMVSSLLLTYVVSVAGLSPASLRTLATITVSHSAAL